jgi:predicted permease
VERTRQALRERGTLPWLESLLRDLAYSLRRLAKHPAVTAIAVLSIGLGIGANATIFSVVSRFFLRPAPVGNPSTLLALYTNVGGGPFSQPLYNDLCQQTRSFSGIAAYDLSPLSVSIGGGGEPETIYGQAVGTNFFDVTQVFMMRGRGFASREYNEPVVILSAQLWKRRFGGDPAILGKPVLLSGRVFTVVGIAPPGFSGIEQLMHLQFWVPLGALDQLSVTHHSATDRDNPWLSVVGRLRPGVKRAQVAAELKTLGQRLALSYPQSDDRSNELIFSAVGELIGQSKVLITLLLALLSMVVLLVLAIAGANVTNLLFVQAAGRQREMAVRLALGATRGRLRRQMLMESLLLGLGGGLLGVTLSLWAVDALSSFQFPTRFPVDFNIRMDWRVLLYSFVLSILGGLLLGAAPAWAAARPQLANALKGEDALARPGRRWSLRNLLVVAQISMTVILLSMTGLFLRSLQSAANIDIGFRPKGLLMLSVDPGEQGYTATRTAAFLDQLRERAAALPGVTGAAFTDVAPLTAAGGAMLFHIAGRPASERHGATAYMATPGYFDTLGMPLIAGHDFDKEAATGEQTILVNRAFAEKYFKGESPLGQHLVSDGLVPSRQVVGGSETHLRQHLFSDSDSYRIIGIASNFKGHEIGEAIPPTIFRSLAQTVATAPSGYGYTLLVHTTGDASALGQSLRRQVHALDPAMAVYSEETMEEHVRSAYVLPRLAAIIFGVCGGIGLVLAVVGIYGVMSYSVSRRTHEIGIRMAMGAKPGTVERLVLRQGLALTLIAMALGWPAAWMLAKLAASFLYGIQPHDAVTFAVVPPLLIAIALIACWIPARRAASIDPMQALRTE